MQNRGAIRLLAIVFALVSLYVLSFTYITSRVESKAKKYATNQEAHRIAEELAGGDELLQGYYFDSVSHARETYYLDSMAVVKVYPLLGYTYKECQEKQINLGLDLKGGMNVTLEVSVGEIVNGLSGNSNNPTFVQAMQMTYDKQTDSQTDFVTLFGESIEEIDPNFSLASIFLYEFRDNGITPTSSNDEVLDVIREEVNGAFDRAYNILRTRIDQFGVTQPNIQKIAATNRVLVELPGIKDPRRVRKLLQGTAKLEFWETYNYNEIYQYFSEANNVLAKKYQSVDEEEESQEAIEEIIDESTTDADADEQPVENIAEDDSTSTDSLLEQLESDSLENLSDDQMEFEEYAKLFPLHAYLRPAYYESQGNQYPGQNATVGWAAIKDTARINKLLKETKDIFPRDLKLAWTVKPIDESGTLLELTALKVTARDKGPALGGEVITNARQDYDQNGRVEVSMSMNAEGAKNWKRITGQNVDRQIAIVLDGYVYSAPNVNQEIPTGQSSISGNFTVEEGQDLANILKAGKLPAPARIVEEAVVGPSLGHEAVSAGLWSFIIAFVLVLVYMMFYYSRAGLVANVALISNVFFLFGVLASFGAVLTLPGIAGIVLTLGMAVDANVIIFERIKEEVRTGKGMRQAIKDGYQNAYSAIIDGNVTTLLTAIILNVFGSGPIKGFATTLIIGILTSLFTAIFISRMIFTWMMNKEKNITFFTSFTENFLAKVNVDFLSKRKIAYLISGAIIVLGLVSLTTRGLNFGVDFSGGRTYIVRFDQNVSTDDVGKALDQVFIDENGVSVPSTVKTFGPSKQVKITTKYMIGNNDPEVDGIIQEKLFEGLHQFYADQTIELVDFVADSDVEDKLIGILSSQKVGPTIADDIRQKSIWAVSFALIVIFGYIALRFRKWQFGLGGVAALFHDSLITISIFSMFYNILPFNMEIDQAFIAAILTIIGYSINDTVIIFDRIREYTTLHKKTRFYDNINNALNSTLARTINTSGTTLIVLITIFLFGGEVIRGFVFALLVGVLVGTYSSLFTASPIMYDLVGRKDVVQLESKKAKKTTNK